MPERGSALPALIVWITASLIAPILTSDTGRAFSFMAGLIPGQKLPVLMAIYFGAVGLIAGCLFGLAGHLFGRGSRFWVWALAGLIGLGISYLVYRGSELREVAPIIPMVVLNCLAMMAACRDRPAVGAWLLSCLLGLVIAVFQAWALGHGLVPGLPLPPPDLGALATSALIIAVPTGLALAAHEQGEPAGKAEA